VNIEEHAKTKKTVKRKWIY